MTAPSWTITQRQKKMPIPDPQTILKLTMASAMQPEAGLQALIKLAQEGETEAFGKIYDSFFTQVYRYAAFRLPKEMAEDTTADIFVKAWEKLHTYKAQKNVPFGAWLFRIARHSVI